MTYSLEISLAALSKLQSIVERQKADQELLARVLTDAVEKFLDKSYLNHKKIDAEVVQACEELTINTEAFLRSNGGYKTLKETLSDLTPESADHIDALAEDCKNSEFEEPISESAQAITKQLVKLHKAADEYFDTSPGLDLVTFPAPLEKALQAEIAKPESARIVKERGKWGSGKNKTDGKDYTEGADKAAQSQIRQQDPLKIVIEKRIAAGVDPTSEDKPVLPPQEIKINGGGLNCKQCKKRKPLRWMEVRKPGDYTGYCQNCANARDQIDNFALKQNRGVEF